MKLTLPAVLALAAAAAAQNDPPQPQTQPSGLGSAPPPPQGESAFRDLDPPRQRPHFLGEIGFAGGRFEHRTKGSTLDDDTDGALFRLQFEGSSSQGFGGGIRLEGISSDDDLFADTGTAAEGFSGELFAFFAYRPPDLRIDLPLRVGFTLSNYRVEENVSEDRIDYTSAGVKFEIAPEFPLIQREHFRWSIYSAASLGFGASRVESDTSSPGDFDADSEMTMFGFDVGTRFRFGHASLGVGYVYRELNVDDSDVVGGSFFLGIEQSFSGLMLTFGLNF